MKFIRNLFSQQTSTKGSKISKNFYLLIAFLLVLLTSGCKKWLEKPPSNSFGLPDSIQALQALLDNKATFNVRITPSMPEASADDYFLLQTTFDGLDAPYAATYNWQENSFNGSNDWRLSYSPVYISNLCLEQVQKIPITDINSMQWNNIKGSALFLRSYFFLMLSWAYSKTYDSATANSDLGIALRLTSDINEPSVRANVSQSYDQIIKDAKESVFFLPELPLHCLRPSKAAAYGLLARIYLSMRQYDSAMKYSDKSLQISNQLMNYNGDSDIITDLSGSGSPFKQYNKETIFYSEMNVNHPSSFPGNGLIDSSLYISYSNNDLRKKAFFRSLGSYVTFKGNYSQLEAPFFTGISTDEMLLVRAECQARRGNVRVALDDLDSLLLKRWITGTYHPISVSTPKEVLDVILQERRKELVMRGIRWMDLKRLNKEGRNITVKRVISGATYQLQPNDNRYALPLPKEIIDLSGMPQNPR